MAAVPMAGAVAGGSGQQKTFSAMLHALSLSGVYCSRSFHYAAVTRWQLAWRCIARGLDAAGHR